MTTRITAVDVRRQFTERYVPALASLGVSTDGFTLERGVSHWTLTDKDGFAAPGVVGHGLSAGYIGSTAREAYATLQTIAKTLEFAGSFMVANADRVLR
jgi:hypothetical protein